MRRLAVIPPGRFHLGRVHEFRQSQKITGMLGWYGEAFGNIERQTGRPRDQVFERDDLDRTSRTIQARGPAQGCAIGPKNIDAKGAIGVDELQQGFAGRVPGVDVPEQEIAGQGLGDTVECAGDEVDVVQGALRGPAAEAQAMKLDGKPAG